MTATAGEASGVDPRRVFVVHGRDERVRKGMFVFLRAIGLVPIEWEKAIAETGSASPYVGQVLDSAFGGAQAVVVLLTPDEIAYLDAEHGSGPDDPEMWTVMQFLRAGVTQCPTGPCVEVTS